MKVGKSGFNVCIFRLVVRIISLPTHPHHSLTYFQRCDNQLPLPDATRERLPTRTPRAPNWTQKPARSADSAPVASSSRVQLSADRAISETDVDFVSPSSPTLPSRGMKHMRRAHPYKHARPPSMPRIVVKRETQSAESLDSTGSNWLDVEMTKPDQEETKRWSYSKKLPFAHRV